jgi:hypothetical protein
MAITRLKGVITPRTFGKGKKSIELETVAIYHAKKIAVQIVHQKRYLSKYLLVGQT